MPKLRVNDILVKKYGYLTPGVIFYQVIKLINPDVVRLRELKTCWVGYPALVIPEKGEFMPFEKSFEIQVKDFHDKRISLWNGEELPDYAGFA